MTANKIPSVVRNSCLQECIDEYVRSRTHRKMLAEWYFSDLTMEGLAEKYNLSVTRAKEIVREIGGPIVEMARYMSMFRQL